MHQCNKPAAAGDFELAEDGVEMLFHHRQTQTGVVSDLLVAPSFTNKLGQLPVPALSAEQDAANGPLPALQTDHPFRHKSSHLIRKCGCATPRDLSCFKWSVARK